MMPRLLLAAAGLLLAAPALAVDWSAQILDADKEPYSECAKWEPQAVPPRCLTERKITLGTMAAKALDQVSSGTAPSEIEARGRLANKILDAAGGFDLTDRERDLVKTALWNSANPPLGYRPSAIVQAVILVDPAAAKDK